MDLKKGVPFVFLFKGGGGGGVHVPFISTSMREVGVVYDRNIESKIDLAGNAVIKIYVIDY